jgi:CheY-like chemotaxis protein
VKPFFTLGHVVATPGALAAIGVSGDDLSIYLARHQSGDWGDIDAHDRSENQLSLEQKPTAHLPAFCCPKSIEKLRRKEMLKILVAEDDHNLAHYYETLLNQWDCETVVEHRGTDAIRRAATFRPDVALLGVVIPEMGGVEVAIKLLEISPGTKIVLVTESVPHQALEQLAAQANASARRAHQKPDVESECSRDHGTWIGRNQQFCSCSQEIGRVKLPLTSQFDVSALVLQI